MGLGWADRSLEKMTNWKLLQGLIRSGRLRGSGLLENLPALRHIDTPPTHRLNSFSCHWEHTDKFLDQHWPANYAAKCCLSLVSWWRFDESQLRRLLLYYSIIVSCMRLKASSIFLNCNNSWLIPVWSLIMDETRFKGLKVSAWLMYIINFAISFQGRTVKNVRNVTSNTKFSLKIATCLKVLGVPQVLMYKQKEGLSAR